MWTWHQMTARAALDASGQTVKSLRMGRYLPLRWDGARAVAAVSIGASGRFPEDLFANSSAGVAEASADGAEA